ncbi:MAG: thioredoxin domain-containing protein [Chitinophagaceae bacterium]
MKFTNHLIHESSPYLRQHAHNPVNWYPWGREALNKSKSENKPILVSIGYSACHWCHVMERESFENEDTAKLMNEHFINIKIDREERPDLDHIYMDAVQAMTGSGGWPLNVFLTPDKKPFFGGTYFPPNRAHNRPSWQETLLGVVQAFRERRHEIDAQAENLTEHLLKSNAFGIQTIPEDEIFSSIKIEGAVQNLLKSADKEWGGFGRAPKFPQTFSIQFLLRFSYCRERNLQAGYHSSESIDEDNFLGEIALKQALLSLDKMIEGGIYDQVGGGFSRYSTDTEWLTPHFEKMLYDNALLVSVLSEAYQYTKIERYKEVMEETLAFIQEELMHPQKGFYAALDADSEGVEGKFYLWSKEEVNMILENDTDVFCEYYDITKRGNLSAEQAGWENKNILRVKKRLEIFAAEKGMAIEELKNFLNNCKKKLLEQRNKRIRPLLDDKILLGWNALMNAAICKAYAATGNEDFRKLAISNMEFLLQKFSDGESGQLYHTWKNDVASHPAFLDDYAFVIQALINLQEITADRKWLFKAKMLTEFVLENFSEDETPFFFYTSIKQSDLIIRKKEVYDGAVPSGNSVMAYNLWQLSILFDIKSWKQRSIDMVSSLGVAINKYSSSFGNWACLLQEITEGTNEIAILGAEFNQIHKEILTKYIPHRVLMASKNAELGFPLLAGKKSSDQSMIFLCSNNTCLPPVFSAKELISLINKGENQ